MSEHHGSCQCGAVQYEVHGVFDGFYLCHCSRCRKDTGSAFAANLFSQTAKLQWHRGEEFLGQYRIPATRHVRSFCKRCGCGMPSVLMNGALLMVPAGSLDSDLAFQPKAHLCLADKAGWDEALEKLPGFPGMPQ